MTEQPQLTVMHTIWLREHNRIAHILASLNPSWCSDIVSQKAHRIVIAEIQHITYNEFLPKLLGTIIRQFLNIRLIKSYICIGNTAMTKYQLTPLSGGNTFSGYTTNGLTSGPISNEFATAAFRIGHSLV